MDSWWVCMCGVSHALELDSKDLYIWDAKENWNHMELQNATTILSHIDQYIFFICKHVSACTYRVYYTLYTYIVYIRNPCPNGDPKTINITAPICHTGPLALPTPSISTWGCRRRSQNNDPWLQKGWRASKGMCWVYFPSENCQTHVRVHACVLKPGGIAHSLPTNASGS